MWHWRDIGPRADIQSKVAGSGAGLAAQIATVQANMVAMKADSDQLVALLNRTMRSLENEINRLWHRSHHYLAGDTSHKTSGTFQTVLPNTKIVEVGGPIYTGAISRATAGLVMFDDFHLGSAGNNNTLGGGWIEEEDAADDIRILEDGMGSGPYLVDHKVENESDVMRRTADSVPDSFIAQFNYGGAVSDALTSIFWHSNGNEETGSVDHYALEIRAADPDRGWLRVVKASAVIDGEFQLFGFDLGGGFRQGRVVHERSGANAKMRQYWANNGAALVDIHEFLAGDLTQRGAELDDIPEEFNTNNWGFVLHDGQDLAYVFMCGRNIVVNGIPTGFKIQLDSRTAVVESGGSVTIDVDTFELPINTIKLLDASDVVLATLTPPSTPGRNGDTYGGGIWGGDIFNIDAEDGRMTVLDKEAGPWAFLGQVAWAANATGKRDLQLRLNGTTVIESDTKDAPATGTLTNRVLTILDLAEGDFVEMRANQDSGGALNMLGGRDLTFLIAVKLPGIRR